MYDEEIYNNPELSRLHRLSEEHAELYTRLIKLNAFLDSEEFKKLEAVDKGALYDQYDYMKRYFRALSFRLFRTIWPGFQACDF